MTEEEKQQKRELYESQPEKYEMLKSGAVKDRKTNRIIDNLGGPYTITPERSMEFHEMRRQLGLISQLRGLARSGEVELGEDVSLEQIVQGAGNAVEALTKHMAGTFLTSKNLRGMGETYRQLVAPMVGDSDHSGEQRKDHQMTIAMELTLMLIKYVRMEQIEGEYKRGEITELPYFMKGDSEP